MNRTQPFPSVPLPLFLRTITLVLALSASLDGCGLSGPSETDAEFWARMESFVTERMDPAGSGFGFVVISDGVVAFAKPFDALLQSIEKKRKQLLDT